MEQSGVFTVSVPRAKELSAELGFCGSRSGRDVNKEQETGLTRLRARAGGADAVAQCGSAFECRIVQKQLLELDVRARPWSHETRPSHLSLLLSSLLPLSLHLSMLT